MSLNTFTFLVIVCAPALCQQNRTAVQAKVTEAAERYPYIVCLLDKGTIRECTGTLIKAEWVLTAAHCVIHNFITHIQYGNMSIPPTNTNSKSPVLEIIPHPDYTYGQKLTDDIGLLRVQAVPIKIFGRISWINFDKLMGRHVEYAGFGIRMTQKMLKSDFRIETLILVQTRPLYISEGVVSPCESIEGMERSNTFICVKPLCYQNSTKMRSSQCVNIHYFAEDSGGPLFYDMNIVGVTSWRSANLSTPAGLYTPVAHYKPWIDKIVKMSPPKSSIAKKLQQTIQDMWRRFATFFKSL